MTVRTDKATEIRGHPTKATPLSALSHPDHAWLYDYWLKRKPQDGVPSRRDIDPADFPKMLPRVAVIAADPADDRGHFRYRYRLAGTEIVSRSGRDPTGKSFEDLYEGDYLQMAQALYDRLRRSAEPHFSQHFFPIANGEGFLKYDRLILPLAADHHAVDQFFLLIVVVEQGGASHRQGSFPRAGKLKHTRR